VSPPFARSEQSDRFAALLAIVAPLAETFAAAGFSLYLVGGIVRDQLLGRELLPDGDLDLTTDATPSQIKRLVAPSATAVWTQGERFGTIGARIDDRVVEITTHRAEAYDSDSRKPTVAFSTKVVDDLSRRDFTVNAMAVEARSGTLVDPFDGQHDLENGVLRTPLDPDVSFSDDPLRMLRAARFRAGYDLAPEPALVASMQRLAPRLAIVSVERIRVELDKLVCLIDPTTGLELLVTTGVIDRFLPELHDPVLAVRAARAATGAPRTLVARVGALLHELDPRAVRARVAALRYANDEQRRIVAVAGAWRSIMSPFDLSGLDGRVRRFVDALGADTDIALAVARSAAAAPDAVLEMARIERFIERVHSLRAVEDLDDLRPALGGAAVMAILGIVPGPQVGAASRYLLALRLDEGPLTATEAEARLRTWWRQQA
jgi:poly(A) polymerase